MPAGSAPAGSLPTRDASGVGSAGSSRDQALVAFLKQQSVLSAYAFALCGDWEIADEAVQETALFLADRWTDFTPGTDFAAWLCTIARYRVHRLIARYRPARQADVAALDDLVGSTASVWDDGYVADAQRLSALQRCLDQLPEPHRDLLALHYRDRLGGEEIAARLGRRVNAIYTALSRIRDRLRLCCASAPV